MKLLKQIMMFLFLLSISGCAFPPALNWNNPQEIASKISVEKDDFRKVITYQGPEYGEYYDIILIRAWKDLETMLVKYQIYVRATTFDDWMNFNSCYASDGQKLDMKNISSNVTYCTQNGCWCAEDMGLDVDKSYLEKHINNGLKIKIYGQKGQREFYLPGIYISAFLNHIEKNSASSN